MLDHRIYTFLELCNVMNYHTVAKNLNMTQPAVTQHIKHLESMYNCKLFEYSNKKLCKTNHCLELEQYARSIISLNRTLQGKLSDAPKVPIKIGATRTIGEYVLDDALVPLLSNPRYDITILIDNTEVLFQKLDRFELDLLMLEGYVNKESYMHRAISSEDIVGICSVDHPFAGKKIPLSRIIEEPIILRESGSGTRAVLESFFKMHGYLIDTRANRSIISSNKLIEHAVMKNLGISFVYQVVPDKNESLATFTCKEGSISHEFNYVYLNNEKANEIIHLLPF